MSFTVTTPLQETEEDITRGDVAFLKGSSGKRDSCTPRYKLPVDLSGCPSKAKLSDPESLPEDLCIKYKYPDHGNDQFPTKRTTRPFFQNIENVFSVVNCYARKKIRSAGDSEIICRTRPVAIAILVIVVGGTLVTALGLLICKLERTDSTVPVPTRTESTKKHCSQIGTRASCYENANCRWLKKRHTCVLDYIETVNFDVKERTSDEPKQKFSELLSGTVTPRSNRAKWVKEYSEYLVRFHKPADRLILHLDTYQKNVEEIHRHNNQYVAGATTWWKGINFFTDITEEELKSYTGYNGESDERNIRSSNATKLKTLGLNLPDSLDYRDKGIVSPVKDQGGCGSCFAFAVLSVMESKYALLNQTFVDLSEQQIVDCSTSYGNKGCHGGNFESTFKFMTEIGVDTEENIPYEGVGNRSCGDTHRKYENRIGDWKSIDQNEEAMMEAMVKHGPIVTSLTVDKDFFTYGGGVFTAANSTKPNHAVPIVGYGMENGTDVWYIKNSWGTTWGQEGFMSIQRNVNLRQIAEGSHAIISTVLLL